MYIARHRFRPALCALALLLSAPVAAAQGAEAGREPLAAGAETAPPAIADIACPVHVVQPGETLRLIAQQYLGSRDRSGAVYASNRAAIGANADIIVPGMRLQIPCNSAEIAVPPPDKAANPDPPPSPDPAVAVAPMPAVAEADPRAKPSGAKPAPGSASGLSMLATRDTPQTPGRKVVKAVPPPVSSVQDTTNTGLAPYAPVHVLTGAPYLPFIDPNLSSGGMLTELVLAAFAETEGGPLEIGFVNDRNAHLDIILPRGGFAFSFPWKMPTCAPVPDTPRGQQLCRKYVMSDSLYEHVTEYISRADSPFNQARVLDDLRGAVHCRPEGYPVQDLRDAGLYPAATALVRHPSPLACLQALDRGEVDIVSLDASLTRAIVTGMQLDHPLIVLEELTRIERLRAVALRSDANGTAAIERLNAGLAVLIESGEWYAIVERHLHGKVM